MKIIKRKYENNQKSNNQYKLFLKLLITFKNLNPKILS